jgi:DNA-binding XRE family transcriptional regulator
MSEISLYLLRKAREDFDITQEDLAVETGLSTKTISRAEKGDPISLFVATQICEYFSKRYYRKIEPSELGLKIQRRIRVSSGHNDDIVDAHRSAITELLHPLIAQHECAWAYAWGLGEEVSNVELAYDSAIRYEATLPDDVQQAIDSWCKENPELCREKQRDPVGALVRLERVQWSHSAYKYFILLSPSRYLVYVAVHPHLGKNAFSALREASFANALKGLRGRESLKLPSNFALHMAVVSQDGYLLLRRRASDTALYPLAWEAGIGEFMHGPVDLPGPEYRSGPYHSQFPHFTADGQPDLPLFLGNAVAEELGYDGARQEDFRLYGFAVEYETLAPKLLVVYQSDCPIAALLEHARKAKDRARELTGLKLTPSALVEACSSSRYSSWGPTSKLVMLLALRQDCTAKGMEDQSMEITRLIDTFEPGEELIDPRKSSP